MAARRIVEDAMGRWAAQAARWGLDRGIPGGAVVAVPDRVREATRLTRAGRLTEATALLRGATAPSTPAAGGAWGPRAATAGPGRLAPGVSGGRAFRVVAPTRPQGGGAGPGLLVMLHGGTQDAESFAHATGMDELAEREGFVVVYPEQSRRANAMGYWNWFDPRHQGRGGEPAVVAGILVDVAARHGADPTRVAVAGFSAGAALAAVIGGAYPEVVTAVGVHSGLPAGAAHDVGSAFAAMRGAPPAHPVAAVGDPARRPPVVVVHGDGDRTVVPVNGERVVAAALAGVPGCVRSEERGAGPGRSWTRERRTDRAGRVRTEHWTVHGAGHAWSGGRADASYTDPAGPDASAAMVDFFALRRDGGGHRHGAAHT